MHFSHGGYEVTVSEQISGVAAKWNAFNAQWQHLNPGYLAALEASHPADMEFRYVVVTKADRIVACAYLQLVNYSAANFSGQGSPLLIAALKLFFRMKKVRLLFCGNLFSCDFPCLHFLPEEIPFETALHIIRSISEKEKCQLMMMKETKTDAEGLRVLHRNHFRKYDEDLTMALQVNPEWKTFEDYQASLSKKYRKRLKLILRSGERAMRRRLSEEEVQRYLPDIGRLFRQTASRQFLKMGIIDENYFIEMQKAFGERFFINGYFLNDKLVAFASHIIHDDLLEVHYIGIDYAHNDELSLYFNILYDGVRQSISMHKKTLELGRTAREAKASVGCLPVASYDYLYVSSRFVNFLITVFENLFLDKMGDEWKNRHPFKKLEIKN